ncbi:MAG: transglycosylase SLT domain-containing protein, partial [Myxococcota bacterium]
TVVGPGRPDPALVTGAPASIEALRLAERELFGDTRASSPDTCPSSLVPGREVSISASGLPPGSLSLDEAPQDETLRSPALMSLRMPNFPVRMSERVIRYLDFFRRDPRGRMAIATWYRVSGRYESMVREILREHGVPDDLMWVAVVESRFEADVRSRAGAAGLWQFMPHTGRAYGLVIDRWIDERLDPLRSTRAAATMLSDLHARFGSWELALAAYNMGYGRMIATIRSFNSNDFRVLSRYESAIPWETTLYVPRIASLAIAAENPEVFGLGGVDKEPAEPFDNAHVGPGTALPGVAAATGTDRAAVRSLNPQYLASRVPPYAPPEGRDWIVRVPSSKSDGEAGPRVVNGRALPPTVLVEHGQTIEDVARSHAVRRADLARLNVLRPNEVLHSGTHLMLPSRRLDADEKTVDQPLTVVLPRAPTVPEGFERRFYRVVDGDDLHALAARFVIHVDDLRRWNALDVGSYLHSGMVLLVLVPRGRTLGVPTLGEEAVRVVQLGSDAFQTHVGKPDGRVRGAVVVQAGDTFQSLAERLDMSVYALARVNHRSHREKLRPGEVLVTYVPRKDGWKGSSAPTAMESNRDAVVAPFPGDLPPALSPRAGR